MASKSTKQNRRQRARWDSKSMTKCTTMIGQIKEKVAEGITFEKSNDSVERVERSG